MNPLKNNRPYIHKLFCTLSPYYGGRSFRRPLLVDLFNLLQDIDSFIVNLILNDKSIQRGCRPLHIIAIDACVHHT